MTYVEIPEIKETAKDVERDVRFARLEAILKAHDKTYTTSGMLGSMERVTR
jgi:hypothetical protein